MNTFSPVTFGDTAENSLTVAGGRIVKQSAKVIHDASTIKKIDIQGLGKDWFETIV